MISLAMKPEIIDSRICQGVKAGGTGAYFTGRSGGDEFIAVGEQEWILWHARSFYNIWRLVTARIEKKELPAGVKISLQKGVQ